ncbi:MAG: hypothetical protein ACI9R3_004287 [Verrucomicrobiales bacterium]|jgi:hypothetical protein
MGFVAILFGLPLAALPIIVHLLAKRRKQVVNWGAMQFLIAAKQQTKRSWRLRDVLLLALRVLALIALIFAISRPAVPIAWLGGHEPRDIIVIVDESMSTAALDGTRTFYERQREELKRLFSEMDVDGTDHLRVIAAGAIPTWLTEIAVKGDGFARKAIVQSLEQRKPSLARADLPAAIETALTANPTQPGLSRHVYILTDGQSFGWNPDMTSRWKATQDKLNEFPEGSEVRVWPTESETFNPANLVVQKVELAREVVAAMEPVMFRATVTNFSKTDSDTAIIHWLVDGEEIGVVTVPSIPPDADSTIGLEYAFTEPGLFEVSCRMDGSDVLVIDDEATAIIEVAAGIPVLIVEGAPSDDPLETDSAFVLAALGGFADEELGRTVESPFKSKLITAPELDSVDLESYQVIVLANVSPLDAAVIGKLTNYVRAGGGLWISIGDQMQPKWFNDVLAANGAGLAPLEISAPEGDAAKREEFEMVSPPTQPHPATNLLSDTDKLDIDRAQIYRRFPFSGTVPRDLTVLLQLDNGSPIAVERRLGEGRVIVQSVPLGASWSNMPLLLSYVAMVHEWLWYLVEPGMVARNLNPGDPISFEILSSREVPSDSALLVEMPSGEVEPFESPVASKRKIHFTNTLNPGLYRFTTENHRDIGTFSVERNPEESNLARISDPEREKLRGVGMFFGSEQPKVEETKKTADRPASKEPIWEWLLIGVIVFLIGESLLALWISKGRNAGTAGASM